MLQGVMRHNEYLQILCLLEQYIWEHPFKSQCKIYFQIFVKYTVKCYKKLKKGTHIDHRLEDITKTTYV